MPPDNPAQLVLFKPFPPSNRCFSGVTPWETPCQCMYEAGFGGKGLDRKVNGLRRKDPVRTGLET